MKVRHCDAAEVAKEMAKEYQYSTPVDTIVCMDGCEIIGSCLAEELTRNGIMSLNRHNSMYIITPELDKNGQMIFRDNLQPMVQGKKHPAFCWPLPPPARPSPEALTASSITAVSFREYRLFSVQQEKSTDRPCTVFSLQRIFRNIRHSVPANVHIAEQEEKIDAIVNGFGYSNYDQ